MMMNHAQYKWPGSHHGRSNQPPFAPLPGESAVEDGRDEALHGSAPTYLSQLVRVSPISTRSSLSRLCMHQSSVRLSIVGGRVSSVSGPTIWNNLPDHVTSAPSLPTFRQHLKNFLFSISFPDVKSHYSGQLIVTFISGSWSGVYYSWTTLKLFWFT